jgi:putative transposase
MENTLVFGLVAAGLSQRRVLEIVGLSRSTWHYRLNPRRRVAEPVAHRDRAYPNRIGDDAREQIQTLIEAGWADDHSVDHAFACAWDDGIMVASQRTWWRIAADLEDQTKRPKVATRKGTRQPRQMPVLVATGPGQVWSWDITDVKSIWAHVVFKVYSIIDIYSRKIVGYRIERREANDLAVEMFEDAIACYGAPKFVHADSGATMKSAVLKDTLAAHGTETTHNRPYVSNDNPYSESAFRTMKYRPTYPGMFDDLDHARAYVDVYVQWYNTEHRHSGIAHFTPDQVHDGSWNDAWDKRQDALVEYYAQHSERFAKPPTTPAPAGVVGINHREIATLVA